MSNTGEVNSLMDSDQYSKFCEEEDLKHWVVPAGLESVECHALMLVANVSRLHAFGPKMA